MIDIVWEGWPNWISAGTSALTLIAAIFAGIFAAKAAHWTKEQAEASDDQVTIARAGLAQAAEQFEKQLAVAREELALTAGEADRQRQEAERANRRLTESRLDALAPVIYARATPGVGGSPGMQPLAYRDLTPGAEPREDWRSVDTEMHVGADKMLIFRTALLIEFVNISDRLAHIDVIDYAAGESPELKQGQTLVVLPNSSKTITWTRQLTSQGLGDDIQVNDPRHWLFNLKFWARDLGFNVQDTYMFNGDMRYFSRDGSRLVVAPQPSYPWTENHAALIPGRVYERLDAEPEPAPPS